MSTLLDTWKISIFFPLPPFQECKSFHGMFVGSACGPHGPYVPDVLFWCVVLFFTTFFLSSFLKQFKTKRYFPTKVTELNFGNMYVSFHFLSFISKQQCII